MSTAVDSEQVTTYRDETTQDHPLFAGNCAQYRQDKLWRRSIPLAPSGARVPADWRL